MTLTIECSIPGKLKSNLINERIKHHKSSKLLTASVIKAHVMNPLKCINAFTFVIAGKAFSSATPPEAAAAQLQPDKLISSSSTSFLSYYHINPCP